LRAVTLDVVAAERGVGADAADHDVDEPAAIACEFVGLDARNVRTMEMARMCVHVRKHHLLVNCGDAIRASSGGEHQSDRDHARQNRRSQPTGACLLRVRYSSPKYR